MKSENIFNTKSEQKNKLLVKILEYLMINGYSFPHEITKSLDKSKQSISRELRYLEKKKLIRWRNWIEFPNERVPVEITFKGILLLSNEKSFNIKYIIDNFNSIFNARLTHDQIHFLEDSLKNTGITKVLQIFFAIINEHNLWDSELQDEYFEFFNFEGKDLLEGMNKAAKKEHNSPEWNQLEIELGIRTSSLEVLDIINIKKAQKSLIETLSKDDGKKIIELVFSDFLIPLYENLYNMFNDGAIKLEQKLEGLEKVEKSLEKRIKQKSSNV